MPGLNMAAKHTPVITPRCPSTPYQSMPVNLGCLHKLWQALQDEPTAGRASRRACVVQLGAGRADELVAVRGAGAGRADELGANHAEDDALEAVVAVAVGDGFSDKVTVANWLTSSPW